VQHCRLSGDLKGSPMAEPGSRNEVVLKGDNADVYVSQVKVAFTANLPDGMNKLAAAMTNANSRREGIGR